MRLIDADKLYIAFLKAHKDIYVENRYEGSSSGFSTILVERILNAQPTIEAEPVRYGKWVKLGQRTYGGGRNYTHYCSECGKHGFDDYERCHGCGARMDGEE